MRRLLHSTPKCLYHFTGQGLIPLGLVVDIGEENGGSVQLPDKKLLSTGLPP
ncbi:hypothetical protein BH11VER1_BH11VER1_07140 [soil metagenome]